VARRAIKTLRQTQNELLWRQWSFDRQIFTIRTYSRAGITTEGRNKGSTAVTVREQQLLTFASPLVEAYVPFRHVRQAGAEVMFENCPGRHCLHRRSAVSCRSPGLHCRILAVKFAGNIALVFTESRTFSQYGPVPECIAE
jgi:hypothetical protein